MDRAYAKTTNGVEIYTTDDVTEVIENGIIVKAVIRERPALAVHVEHLRWVIRNKYWGSTNPFILTPYQLYRYLKHEITERHLSPQHSKSL